MATVSAAPANAGIATISPPCNNSGDLVDEDVAQDAAAQTRRHADQRGSERAGAGVDRQWGPGRGEQCDAECVEHVDGASQRAKLGWKKKTTAAAAVVTVRFSQPRKGARRGDPQQDVAGDTAARPGEDRQRPDPHDVEAFAHADERAGRGEDRHTAVVENGQQHPILLSD